MTRLIDADTLKAVFEEKSSVAVCGAKLCKAIISRIDDAPTVDAIPIEWIKKYTEENRLYQSDDFDLYISDMIADWTERKEK